jgi:nitroreductase
MPSGNLTKTVWEIDAGDFPQDKAIVEQVRFLLRYAILAPSSHNSQPWVFRVSDNTLSLAADDSRWLHVADPDKRELYISLGCAVENVCVAARQFGFDFEVEYHDPSETGHIITITFEKNRESVDPRHEVLFESLTSRVTSHETFEDRVLDDATYEAFEASVPDETVTLRLVDDSDAKNTIAELQAEADRLQMDDPEYRKELGHWIGIGALGRSWLMARILQSVVTFFDVGESEAKKNSKLIQSASAIAVLTTETDDPEMHVRTGQVFERLALLASNQGVAVHPMSQILERKELRTQLREVLNTSGRPQHLFRLGYVDQDIEHTPRWPLQTFLEEG